MGQEQALGTSQMPEEKFISISDLFSKSWEVYKTIFWKLIGMSLLAVLGYLPAAFVFGMIAATVSLSPSLGATTSNIIYIVLGLVGLAAAIFGMYFYLIAQVGLYLLIKDRNPEQKVWQTFKIARPLALNFFGTNLLTAIFIFLWSLLFIVPGIIMAVFYTFVPWIFILEGLEGKVAMRRSKELVKGKWWPVFWRGLVPALIVWIIFGIPAALIQPDTQADKTYSSFMNILSIIISPFFLAYTYYMFVSLVNFKNKNISNNPS